MKTLTGLAAIAAALSLFALPAAAGGGHRGHADGQHGLNRSNLPVTHFQARDLRDHGLDRGNGHRHFGQSRRPGHFHMRNTVRQRGHNHGRNHGHHNTGKKRRHGAKHNNGTVVFNFGFAAPAVTHGRSRQFARRPLPVHMIRDRLYRSHYSRLGPVYYDRGHYHVRARNGRGARVKLVIHAGSGTIVQRYYLR